MMKNIIRNLISSYKHIPYTWKHYKAVCALQYLYIGKIKYKFHDIDKLLMFIFIPWIGADKINEWHRNHCLHHKKNGCPEETLFDWESARFTKPDKPLNAVDTCKKYYPDWWDIMLPYFKQYGFIKDD